MQFKFQKDYDLLAQTCPPKGYLPQDLGLVYRWVYTPILDENNFKPQYHKKPKRFISKDDLTKCNALGLSFFNNFEGAIERFNELKTDIGESVYAAIGTHIAKGPISKQDGVNGKIERLGHFNHHPYTTARFEETFEIIQPL